MEVEKDNKEKKGAKTEVKEKQPRNSSAVPGSLNSIRKHIVTVLVGFGAFVLSFIVFMLFFRGGDVPRDKREPLRQGTTEVAGESRSKFSGESASDSTTSSPESGETAQEVFTVEDLQQYDIDTQKII